MSSRVATWDERYQAGAQQPPQACAVLRDFDYLLPRRGAALDLACGLGGNAVELARHGLDVSAWDISAVAIERLRDYAGACGLSISATVRDAVAEPPPPCRFDVITVSRFLHRPLCAALSAALRHGGLLFYQTFTVERAHRGGPCNPDYLLARNELARLFPDLVVRYYREEGCVGNIALGYRNEASFIGERK